MPSCAKHFGPYIRIDFIYWLQVHNWTSKQTIGDVFRRYAPFFKLYISFANAFDKLAKLLREVLDSDLNPHAKQARKILRPKSTACPSVDNLLIQPIQRIPRYVLLLKELLKCTQGPPDSNTGIGDVSVYCFGMKPMYVCVHSCAILVEQEPAHPDYELCIDALKKIESVAKAVDSGMQLFNNQQKMIEVGGPATTLSVQCRAKFSPNPLDFVHVDSKFIGARARTR